MDPTDEDHDDGDDVKIFLRIRPKLLDEEEVAVVAKNPIDDDDDDDGLGVPTTPPPPMLLGVNTGGEENGKKGTVCVFSPEEDRYHRYHFDRVFDETSTQRNIYDETASQLISRLLSGGDVCLIAYGPKGTGKTYALFGDNVVAASSSGEIESSDVGGGSTKEEGGGVVQHVMDELFSAIHNDTAAAGASETTTPETEMGRRRDVSMRCSFVSVRRDGSVRDLLADDAPPVPPKTDARGESAAAAAPWLRDDNDDVDDDDDAEKRRGGGKRFVVGAKWESANSREEMMDVLDWGLRRRREAKEETGMGSEESSSGQHTIFSIELERKVGTNDVEIETNVIQVVDLDGGSSLESSALSRILTDYEPSPPMMGRSISTIGDVIDLFTKGRRPDDAPRSDDAKLSRLLRNVILGNKSSSSSSSAKTTTTKLSTSIILSVSPSMSNAKESLQTIRFGQDLMETISARRSTKTGGGGKSESTRVRVEGVGIGSADGGHVDDPTRNEMISDVVEEAGTTTHDDDDWQDVRNTPLFTTDDEGDRQQANNNNLLPGRDLQDDGRDVVDGSPTAEEEESDGEGENHPQLRGSGLGSSGHDMVGATIIVPSAPSSPVERTSSESNESKLSLRVSLLGSSVLNTATEEKGVLLKEIKVATKASLFGAAAGDDDDSRLIVSGDDSPTDDDSNGDVEASLSRSASEGILDTQEEDASGDDSPDDDDSVGGDVDASSHHSGSASFVDDTQDGSLPSYTPSEFDEEEEDESNRNVQTAGRGGMEEVISSPAAPTEDHSACLLDGSSSGFLTGLTSTPSQSDNQREQQVVSRCSNNDPPDEDVDDGDLSLPHQVHAPDSFLTIGKRLFMSAEEEDEEQQQSLDDHRSYRRGSWNSDDDDDGGSTSDGKEVRTGDTTTVSNANSVKPPTPRTMNMFAVGVVSSSLSGRMLLRFLLTVCIMIVLLFPVIQNGRRDYFSFVRTSLFPFDHFSKTKSTEQQQREEEQFQTRTVVVTRIGSDHAHYYSINTGVVGGTTTTGGGDKDVSFCDDEATKGNLSVTAEEKNGFDYDWTTFLTAIPDDNNHSVGDSNMQGMEVQRRQEWWQQCTIDNVMTAERQQLKKQLKSTDDSVSASMSARDIEDDDDDADHQHFVEGIDFTYLLKFSFPESTVFLRQCSTHNNVLIHRVQELMLVQDDEYLISSKKPMSEQGRHGGVWDDDFPPLERKKGEEGGGSSGGGLPESLRLLRVVEFFVVVLICLVCKCILRDWVRKMNAALLIRQQGRAQPQSSTSRRISRNDEESRETPPSVPPVEPPSAITTPTPKKKTSEREHLSSLTKPILKDMLRERGLKVSGTKSILIDRLVEKGNNNKNETDQKTTTSPLTTTPKPILKDMLRERGLKVSGTKSILIDRLLEKGNKNKNEDDQKTTPPLTTTPSKRHRVKLYDDDGNDTTTTPPHHQQNSVEEELSNLTVAKLKIRLREKGLRVSGKKADLVHRLCMTD